MPKILIVDDDAHLRETLKDLLELERFEVAEASSGQEAMRQVMTSFFEVILMDFNLEDQKTGIDVIREIRKVNKESEILMMTAQASLDTAIKAIQESVYDFLTKPVDIAYLKKTITNAMEKYRLRQENKRLIEQLRANNEQLLALNNMKSKFMSMASHDLSNALMSLQVSFEMLSPDLAKGTDDQRKKVRYITDSISHISRLVEDLVDWAAIEKGKLRYEKKSFDLGELIETMAAGVRERAAKKGVQVAAEVQALPSVPGDRRRIAQVAANLLENAIRHTPKGGAVKVRVSRRGEEAEVAVIDNGEGIEPADLDKIFQSFYQGPGGQEGGGRLGLGLSISREIVSSHGGKIWVESDGKGKGAAFHFTVPLSEAAQG